MAAATREPLATTQKIIKYPAFTYQKDVGNCIQDNEHSFAVFSWEKIQ